MRTAALILFASAATGAAVVTVRNAGFLAANLRPDVVAQTLAKVEEEWNDETSAFLECNLTHSQDDSKSCAPEKFHKSCPTVVGAILRSSSGDRSVVREYMGDVCGEPALQGWLSDRCQVLSEALTDAMSEDSYSNRENLDTAHFCQGFWAKFAQDEIHRAEREQKIRAEAALKATEDAKKGEAAKEAAEAEATKEKADEAEAAKKKVEDEVAKVAAKETKAEALTNVTNVTKSSGNHTGNATKAEKGQK
jgi:hypothetical protein